MKILQIHSKLKSYYVFEAPSSTATCKLVQCTGAFHFIEGAGISGM